MSKDKTFSQIYEEIYGKQAPKPSYFAEPKKKTRREKKKFISTTKRKYLRSARKVNN